MLDPSSPLVPFPTRLGATQVCRCMSGFTDSFYKESLERLSVSASSLRNILCMWRKCALQAARQAAQGGPPGQCQCEGCPLPLPAAHRVNCQCQGAPLPLPAGHSDPCKAALLPHR